MQKEDAQQANLVHRTSEQTQAQPGPYSLPLREQLHPSITLYGMKDVVPSPLLSWLRSSTPFSFFGRGTVCKGRVSKSSPEMRGRGSVSTGFSSRSCPLFTEVVREGILSLAHWTKRRSRDRLEQPSIQGLMSQEQEKNFVKGDNCLQGRIHIPWGNSRGQESASSWSSFFVKWSEI